MSSILLIIGSVLVGIAAVIHVYIFALESVLFSKPSTWKAFGLRTQSEAEIVKPFAYNQGFYNAFLAVGVVVGLVLTATPSLSEAGYALMLFAAGSMVVAALVLVTSSPAMARAAAMQGLAPLIGAGLIVWGLASS